MNLLIFVEEYFPPVMRLSIDVDSPPRTIIELRNEDFVVLLHESGDLSWRQFRVYFRSPLVHNHIGIIRRLSIVCRMRIEFQPLLRSLAFSRNLLVVADVPFAFPGISRNLTSSLTPRRRPRR